MNYIEECLEKFNNLPQELQDYLNSEKSIKTLEEIEKDFGVDLTLALVLVFINELDLEDLSIYIQEKYKTDNATTNKIIFKLESGIFKDIIDNFYEDNIEEEKDYLLDLSLAEKQSLILSIFGEKIQEQFTLSEDHLFRLNAIIFELIGKDQNLFDRIVRAFLDNKEKISERFIVTKGKTLDPTISNWIKDFVVENGSDLFTPVILAKYLAGSENIKNLNQEEKQILRQILKIYKNLVFFPESMGSAPYSNWEIFPINRDLLSFYTNKKRKLNLPKADSIPSPEEEPALASKVEESEEAVIAENEELDSRLSYAERGIIGNDKLDKSEESQEIKELKEILKKYPKNNLERKAIEAEIKKLEKN